MTKNIKLLPIIAPLLASITNACAGPIAFEPGVYENMLLAVSSNGTITGYYREAQGEGVVKTSAFTFKGEAQADVAHIFVGSDQSFPGKIRAEIDGINLTIPKGLEILGCGLVLMPEIKEGLSYDLITKAPWRELRTIVSDKSHFYSEPKADKKLKSCLVRGDVVGVIAEEGHWAHIDYYSSSGKFIRRWIQDADTNIL